MNHRFVIGQVGLLLLVVALALLAVTGFSSLLWARGSHEEKLAMFAMLVSVALGAAVGGVCWVYGRQKPLDFMGRRDALLMVAVGWLLGAALAALPYRLWALMEGNLLGDHPFHSFIDCYFESMSGLTTTGATILADIESIPRSLLMWRAMTQWLGGLGIVVLFVAVLPQIGAGGKKLFFMEAPGPQKAGVRPRIAETARILWLIYLALTGASVLLLVYVGKLGWFDAVCHTFATMATGGFSTYSASIGHFQSWKVEAITVVFIVLGGVNFGLYYQLVRRRAREVYCDPELRAYLGIMLVASVLVAVSLYGRPLMLTSGAQVEGDVASALRHGVFQVASIQTTTGYATADFNHWDFLPQAVLVVLMFVGGSAGSTSGGIKVIRILMATKILLLEVEKVFRPTVVRTLRVGRGAVDGDLRQAVLAYVLSVIVLFVLGSILLMVLEPAGTIAYREAATTAITMLNNIGPGLGAVGPTHHFGFFSPMSKLLMCLLMILGRLEIYTVVVLFMPSFWRQD